MEEKQIGLLESRSMRSEKKGEEWIKKKDSDCFCFRPNVVAIC